MGGIALTVEPVEATELCETLLCETLLCETLHAGSAHEERCAGFREDLRRIESGRSCENHFGYAFVDPEPIFFISILSAVTRGNARESVTSTR